MEQRGMSVRRKIISILTLSILFSSALFNGGNTQAAVGKWEVFELTLSTTNSYGNPYAEVTLTATFTSPTSKTIQMPGFWDGGQTWKVRMAPNEIGTWTYSTASSDGQLNNQSGQFDCIASNKKGFIKVDPSDPYKFRYDDGTPFFWMGDTSWHLFNNNIVYDGDFKDYIDRRASQHFTNIHAGLYCGSVYENEGGKPFPGAPGDMDNLNPDYFRYVDRKMGLFLTWAQQFVDFSRAQFEWYETYVIARYAAYNVYWVVSGEYDEASTPSEYAYHGNVIDQTDPYDHPISIHTTTTNNEFGNDSWLTYIMQQKFEQDSSIMLWDLLVQLGRTDVDMKNNVTTSIANGNSLYNEIQIDRIFDKPVVNAEFGYEQYDGWTGRTNRTTPDTIRMLAWNMVMAGGFITYGMEATYKAFDGGGPFSWKLPAQELGGSDYMKLLYEFMAGTKWWEMNPDNSVITSGDAVALVNPGSEYVIYLRSGSSVSVDLSSVSGNLNVEWFDTKDGDRFNQGTVSGGGVQVFTKPGGIDGEGVLRLYAGDLVISGLGSYPSNGGYVETFAGDYSHKVWGRVNWSPYNSANGETRIATGDIDGDGRDEIVIGLGPVSGNPSIPGGWFEVLDENHIHLAWGRVNWSTYNSANGESWPTCGDIDGDGRDEIIIGLGSYPTYGGWFEVFDYDAGNLVHKVWGRVNWSSYNSANGESWPTCGDIDGDGRDEVIVGFSSYPANGGWFEVFDYDAGNLVHKVWGRVNWSSYNSANGETRPACGDIDRDGRDEIVIGLGDGGGGYLEVFDDASGGYAHLAWPRICWSTYSSANGETWPAVKK
jgi:hypothetical protein